MKNLLMRGPVLTALGAAIVWALPAHAQDASEAAGGSAQAAAEQDTGEIIVTARRRQESLQDTPVAITAIAADSLEARATVNIGDLQGLAPNLLITNQNSGAAAANVSIRGLTFADVEKSFDPTVAVVVDSVVVGTSTGQFFDFFDIEQIEVLRGPQGTLFGRNTVGGVINIRRTRPTLEWGGRFEASYGSFNSLIGRAVVNVPIVEDVFGVKAFYFHSETDGWYRNGITGNRAGFSNNENYGAAFRLRTGAFEANLTIEQQQQEFEPVVANLTNSTEVFCAFVPAEQCNRNNRGDLYTVFSDPDTISIYKSPAVTLEMELDLGGVTLTSVTGYRKSEEFQTQDFDGTTADLYFAQRTQDYRQFSQEFRAAGQISSNFDYVVGVYYFKSSYDFRQDTEVFGAPAPVQITRGTSESMAAFGDFNWEFIDRFRLFFGGRLTRDEKSNDNNVGGDQFPVVSASFTRFTPRIGVDFRPNDQLLLYTSWSRGYRSGGFSGRGQTLFSSTTPYGPETVDSFEAGLRSQWLDNRVTFNLTAFYAKYNDLQQNTTIPVPPPSVGNETIVTNVGSATIRGIEAELTVRPTRELTFTGSLGLLDSSFSGFITQAPDAAGTTLLLFDYSANDLIYNPDVSASITADYRVPTSFGQLRFNASYRYIAPYDQQISLGPTTVDPNGVIVVNGNDPRVRTDPQSLLDASITAQFDLGSSRARLTLWGRNILDDRGPTHGFTVAGLFSFGMAREPQSFGATLGFEF